jgi:DNA repair exonuclease SbcCD ATPase subunit
VTGIPPQLVPGVVSLNDKLHKLIEAFRLEVELQRGEAIHGSVVLKQVEWSWLFNYGAKNHFNFAELEGQLVVLNAKNGHGKSNFFEIICLALFGEGFPSRENSHYSTAIINSQIPEGANASSRIVFSVNGKDFCIERVFRIMVGKNNLHHYKLELRSLPSYEIVKEGSLAVKSWLASHIGSKTTFLSSCMLTQDGDCNFFAMETADQKKLIDNVFSLNAVQKLEGLLKEAAKVHGSVSTLLSSYLAGVKETKRGEQSVQELTGVVEQLEGRLMELEGETAMLHAAWDSLSPRTFERDLGEYEAELAGMREGEEGDLDALKATRAVLKTKVREGAVQMRRPEGILLNETELRRLPELWKEYRELSPDGRVDPELDAMECWRLLKEKEVWTRIWEEFEEGDGKGIAGLRSGVQEAENELNRLMYERPEGIPHKTMGAGALKTALKKIEDSLEGLKTAETFERRIELLEGVERDYPRLEAEWKELSADLVKIAIRIHDCERFPYNPECYACKAAPWKADLEAAKKKYSTMSDERNRIKPLIESYDNEYGSLEAVQELLAEEREGLNERLTQEELRAQTVKWIALAEWIAAERTARGRLDHLQRDLREAEEKAAKSTRYKREKAEWDVKGRAAEATLRHHLETEIAILEHWEQWYAWDTAQRLRQVELDIEAAATYARRQELTAIVEAYPAYMDEQVLLEERGDLMVKLQKARDLLEAAGRGGEEVRDALRLVDQRQELLKYLSVAFKDYRKWLYTAKLAPMLQEGVKSLLEHMCEGRPLFLEPEWLDSIDTFTWFLRDGSNRVVIEKASGFQRFITGMAMRVAMSRLGICKVVYENLIIDEGFTACDGENLEKVPAFLKKLLTDKLYKGIMLATHLEDLKMCGDKQAGIDRNGLTGLAKLVGGTYVSVAPVKSGKKTKK